jgi:hypothetical protein
VGPAARPIRRAVGQGLVLERLTAVAPEPAGVVAHLRRLEQLLGQRQRATGVPGEKGVGRDRRGGTELLRQGLELKLGRGAPDRRTWEDLGKER